MSESTRARNTSRSVRTERLVELRVRVGKAFFPVTKMSDNGFVITADGRPPLRGFADILKGNDLVRHGLVTCAWQEGDQVGYEFKHATFAAPIAPDYAPTAI